MFDIHQSRTTLKWMRAKEEEHLIIQNQLHSKSKTFQVQCRTYSQLVHRFNTFKPLFEVVFIILVLICPRIHLQLMYFPIVACCPCNWFITAHSHDTETFSGRWTAVTTSLTWKSHVWDGPGQKHWYEWLQASSGKKKDVNVERLDLTPGKLEITGW